MMRFKEEKEAKKEAFRKYLESSGVVDSLTKVLVALYEQNDKPFSALEFIQQKLGGPSLSEYEKVQAEMSDLQIKYNELMSAHQETCKELEELKNMHAMSSTTKRDTDDEAQPKHEQLSLKCGNSTDGLPATALGFNKPDFDVTRTKPGKVLLW